MEAANIFLEHDLSKVAPVIKYGYFFYEYTMYVSIVLCSHITEYIYLYFVSFLWKFDGNIFC